MTTDALSMLPTGLLRRQRPPRTRARDMLYTHDERIINVDFISESRAGAWYATTAVV